MDGLECGVMNSSLSRFLENLQKFTMKKVEWSLGCPLTVGSFTVVELMVLFGVDVKNRERFVSI